MFFVLGAENLYQSMQIRNWLEQWQILFKENIDKKLEFL